MSRKRNKNTRKRKPKAKARTQAKIKAAPVATVVDLDDKRVEKLTEEIVSLTNAMSQGLDERVDLIVGLYRGWENAHPDQALRPHHKLAMVRFGFVGPGGFERCHEPDRLPEAAFIGEDGDLDVQIRQDHYASEVLMCPAMESGRCQGVWRGMRAPPCHLLLLEIHHGLGGGALDDSVEEVVDDFGKWSGPEQCAESFARGERAVSEHRDRGPSY